MSLLLWLLALLLSGDKAKEIPAIAISGVSTQEMVVALTFDACATKLQANGFDQQIFDILKREKIPVTIFITGTWAEMHPGAVKQIAAADWVEIGNHSYSHARLTLLQPDRLRVQIRYTDRILQERLGRPALSLRPPAGAWNRAVVRAANREGLPLILWTVVSGDAGGHIPAARIEHIVLAEAKPGAIIIFHINKRAPFTKHALPGIIAGLRDKGFRFVTVSQLLALPDAVPIKAQSSRLGYRHIQPPKPKTDTDGAPPTSSPEARPSGDASPPPAQSEKGAGDANPPG